MGVAVATAASESQWEQVKNRTALDNSRYRHTITTERKQKVVQFNQLENHSKSHQFQLSNDTQIKLNDKSFLKRKSNLKNLDETGDFPVEGQGGRAESDGGRD